MIFLDRETRIRIAETQPRPHGMPSAPFDRTRLALWLCRCGTYGDWNGPARGVCRVCGAVRRVD